MRLRKCRRCRDPLVAWTSKARVAVAKDLAEKLVRARELFEGEAPDVYYPAMVGKLQAEIVAACGQLVGLCFRCEMALQTELCARDPKRARTRLALALGRG